MEDKTGAIFDDDEVTPAGVSVHKEQDFVVSVV